MTSTETMCDATREERQSPTGALVCALAWAFAAAVVESPLLLAAGLAWLTARVLSSSDGRMRIRKYVPVVVVFVAMVWLTTPWTGDGEVLYSLGPAKVRADGAALALRLSLAMLVAWAAGIRFLGDMSARDVEVALHGLRLPPRFAWTASLTVQYVGLLRRELRQTQLAMRLRGFEAKTGLSSMRHTAHLIGGTLLRATDRAGRVSEAMMCRGFRLDVAPPSQLVEGKGVAQCWRGWAPPLLIVVASWL